MDHHNSPDRAILRHFFMKDVSATGLPGGKHANTDTIALSKWMNYPIFQTPFKQTETMNLSNHFLIAMPSMHDPIFGGTVVYLCEHNDYGALGVVINRPMELTLEHLLEKLNLETEIPAPFEKPVMFGGPVQDDRGFVLHTPDVNFSSMLRISDEVAFTTSRDILEAIASGSGPEKMLVSIGYAGWSAGQLEQEISHNGWLTVSADPSIIFDLPISQRYTAAIKLLGFDPNKLTYEVGHA